MDTTGFHALVKLAQGGDRSAMERLLETIRPYLDALARRHDDSARASASSSDLVQEAKLRAWQRLDQFQGGEDDDETAARFHVWMLQIVRHLATDRHRQRTAQRRKAPGAFVRSLDEMRGGNEGEAPRGFEPPAPSETPSAGLRFKERSQLVEKALESLEDPHDREIVRLHFFEHLTLVAIAERLGWTHDRVRDHYRKSMRVLEQRLRSLRAGETH